MFYTFIVNPQAGTGRFAKGAKRLLAELPQAGLNYDVATTEYPKHAVELARNAAIRSDAVIAVGGDGTVNEVVSGLVQSGLATALGVIPIGSGNDFAKMLDVPRGVGEILTMLHDPLPVPVDYGRVDWTSEDGSGTAIFVNAAGIGIDASVAAAAARIRALTGTPRYIAAVLRTLRHWNAPFVEVQVYRSGEIRLSCASEHLLVLAGNGRCAAGGFYLTPSASINDGMLDACMVRNTSLRRTLALIPAVLRGGKHVDAPEVTLEKADKIVIRSSTPLPIQVDGEVIYANADVITLEVAAGGISVIQPVKP